MPVLCGAWKNSNKQDNDLKTLIYILLISIVQVTYAFSGTLPTDDADNLHGERMRWFQEAKLGIFIHWGIYAVDGVGESWSFHNGHISHEDYMAQLKGFTAENYDPKHWAELIKNCGARYAVLTAKHHDGVALWDSGQTNLNVVDKTPAGRDLIAPFVSALRDQGLKVGLYYSLLDWSDPDYPNFLRNEKRYEDDPTRWASFTRSNHGQIKELSERYQPDLFWFDGDWEQPAERWQAKQIREFLLQDNPGTIINSRLQGYGDYATPEQGIPITRPDAPYWELCLTMNTSWGYQQDDHNYKSTNQIIRILVECISMGGNLLLDIGPRFDGTICRQQVSILEELGRWTGKHAEAIYGTGEGLPAGHYYGPTALSPDRSTLYLYLTHQPIGPLMLKGIVNEVKSIRVVGQNAELDWDIKMKLSWSKVPGIIYVDVPRNVLDEEVTVLAVELEGPIALYRDGGIVVESN
jgi:alpha-L-fucosidase